MTLMNDATSAAVEGLRVERADAGVVVGGWRDVHVAVMLTAPTELIVRKLDVFAQRQASQFPGGIATVTFVLSATGLPDSDTRRVAAELSKRRAGARRASAIILETEGFVASAARAVLTTISMIAGCSSGIEPIFALAFQHRVKQTDGERVLTFVNETFEQLAREQGFYSDVLKEEIAKRGSLHGIPGLPQ